MSISLATLPHEVLGEILEFLPITEFTRLSAVSKGLHNILEDENLWRQRCYKEFNISLTQTFRKVKWKTLYKALNNPSVYTWGEASRGRLGRDPENYSHNSKPMVVEEMNGKGVAQIVCGGWSMTTLTKKGEVWTWGTMNAEATLTSNPDDYDQEELGNAPASYARMMRIGPTTINETPIQVETLKGKNVKSIASGRAHCLALTDRGEVYQWRSVTKLQKIDLPEDTRIIQIAAGWTHSLALSKDGDIFSWQSDSPSIISRGTVPDPAENEKYVIIGGGEYFTIGLTNYGKVYKSEDPNDLSKLSLFNGAVGRKFTHISAAFRRFAAFNESGEVAIWEDTGNEEKYDELQHRQVNQVTFGDWHCGALTDDGELYTWGQPSGGALGHNESFQVVKQPTLVQELQGQYVFNIAFAGWHSAALVVPLNSDA
ncbi:hypothetical protein K7432_004642 [Basidiobolus ranarum]|uniref:F-box domain-containing protein n=1 Tax=Basidiobolus ranarum TaxID=34480 RepID=A0ABR2WXZ0_9FUNG